MKKIFNQLSHTYSRIPCKIFYNIKILLSSKHRNKIARIAELVMFK